MKTLQISRSTLVRWRQEGILKAKKLPSGQYDWDENSVFELINKGEKRGVYLYGRVSTPKQKPDLENQMELLQQFALKQGCPVAGAFQDVASGLSFEKRKEFLKLLDLVIAGKVSTIMVTHKDRLSRVGFDLFKHLFSKYHVNIVVLSELADKKTDQQEILEEVMCLLHSFSVRLLPWRRKKIEEALADEPTKNEPDS